MEILATVFYIILCVLMFALAILIHEFGHFIVARKLGLRVEAFSIGFGPALWKKKVNGVEYRISAIPLGGYVSLPDMDPEGTKKLEGVSDKENGAVGSEFKAGDGETGAAKVPRERIPAWKELLVALAGPMMNVVLAVVIAFLLSLVPSANFSETPAVIFGVDPDGAAAAAGVKPGDRILAVTEPNGRESKIGCWMDLLTEISTGEEREIKLSLMRPEPVGGEMLETSVQPTNSMVMVYHNPEIANGALAVLGEIVPDGPAARAGLAKGDWVCEIDGKKVDSWIDFKLATIAASNRTMRVKYLRGASAAEKPLELTATPKIDKIIGEMYVLGVQGVPAKAASWMPSRNPLKQLKYDASSILRILKNLVSPAKAKATGKQLGGPVMIAKVMYDQTRDNFWDGVGFLRFLNVNLAMLNLLPLPVLDGGLILFALIALVFRRRVPDSIVSGLSLVFLVLFLAGMGYIIFHDSWRAWKLSNYEPTNTVQRVTAPAAAEAAATNAIQNTEGDAGDVQPSANAND